MGISKTRTTYLMGLVVFAFWLSWTYYHKGLGEASLMSETTSIFSNVIFVGVLLMGFAVLLLRRTRRVL